MFHNIAQIVALLIFGIHPFGDTLLPRVHTASQQAHGKLNINSVRFYTHKFLQFMTLGLRKAPKKKMKLVGRTAQDVQTNIRRRSPCLLYTSPSPRDKRQSRMPSSAWKKKRNLLSSSGFRWFPREIDCPKHVAPEPHTIVLWHLIHEFRLIVCTSYTNSSCCTLLYSFILWFCFVRLHKLLLC